MLHLLAKINVDFGKKSVSILHIILFPFMSFRENGHTKAHVLTGVNKITFTRISNIAEAYCFVIQLNQFTIPIYQNTKLYALNTVRNH
jgi:hypothetical protein